MAACCLQSHFTEYRYILCMSWLLLLQNDMIFSIRPYCESKSCLCRANFHDCWEVAPYMILVFWLVYSLWRQEFGQGCCKSLPSIVSQKCKWGEHRFASAVLSTVLPTGRFTPSARTDSTTCPRGLKMKKRIVFLICVLSQGRSGACSWVKFVTENGVWKYTIMKPLYWCSSEKLSKLQIKC